MKAIIQRQYGGIEQLEMSEVPKPICTDKDILIRVHAANVSSGDMRVNTFDVPPLIKPIMGLLFGFKGPRNIVRGIAGSGKVVEVGGYVTNYAVGDKVYFINSMKAGVMAEYVLLNKKSILAPKPEKMSYEEAAPIAFGAMSAYHFINSTTIQKGDEVLIYGASGSVGSYAVQLAVYYGAVVTAVSSKKNHQILQDLGATHLIDYHDNDFRDMPKQYDLIFDAVGKINKKSCRNVLQPNGLYKTVKMPTKEDVDRLQELHKIIKKGHLKTHLDRVYDMSEYKEAHNHTYTGHKVGNVVLKMNPQSSKTKEQKQ